MVVAAFDPPPGAGLLAEQNLAPERGGNPAPTAAGGFQKYRTGI